MPLESNSDFTRPSALAHMAKEYMQDSSHEWLLAAHFTSMRHLDWYTVFAGDRCPLWANWYAEELLDAIQKAHAKSFVLIRSHPHPWVGPTHEGQRQMEQLFDSSIKSGTPLTDLLVLDSIGTIYSIRTCWDYGTSVGSLGVASLMR